MSALLRMAALALLIATPIAASARVAPPGCSQRPLPVIRGERRQFRLSPWSAVFSVRNPGRAPMELSVAHLSITAPVHVPLEPARIVLLPDARLHGLVFDVQPRSTAHVEVGFTWPPATPESDRYEITAVFRRAGCPHSATARLTRHDQ